MFDPASPYKGKVTAYNYAIYVADAALYLMKTKPDLKITNPYALDDTQLAAAKDLLVQQKSLDRQVLGHGPGGDRRLRERRHGDRDRVAVPGQHDQRRRRQEGRGHEAEGRRDGLVRHLDDLVGRQAPELHVRVDGLHHLAEGERAGDRVLR